VDLARAVAEPVLLGRGYLAWDTGHDALLAARLLEEVEGRPDGLRLSRDLPRAPVARALARTLSALREAGIEPERLDPLARRPGATPEDAHRLRAVAGLYRRFHDAVEGRFADRVTLLRTAARHLHEARWLEGARILIVDELELAPVEKEFVRALSRLFTVHLLEAERPPSLHVTSFAAWAAGQGVRSLPAEQTVLGPLVPPPVPAGLARLRATLFEAPRGAAVRDGSVELLTAPGETAEVRAVARRLLREAARGVGFEEMGVILPRPHEYAPLIADLLARLGIPYRLHPSLPLRFGRSARSLLLLLRCRGLARAAVMELLTFAPVPYEPLLGEVEPRPAQWDAISRDAGIVSGLERWIIGLRAHAEAERDGAGREQSPERRERRARRAADAEALLRVVEILSATLDGLAGEASWPEWSERLHAVLDQWVGPERDRAAVSDVLDDLAGLGGVAARAPWREVEQVLEARFEWERLPLEPASGGAVHVGAMDAMAGLSFRVVAVPGLVEGGYPGVLRPDPFLLDPEREALAAPAGDSSRGELPRPKRRASHQLSLFADPPPPRPADLEAVLPTTQDRLWEERRVFHRALRQATERLVLSYPRVEPRSGRERLPSLFLVAAASALEGRPLSGPELDRMVSEDDLDALPLEETLDRSERDRARVRRGRDEAAEAIAAGSASFKQSRLASQGRWSGRLTAYDGLIAPLPPDLAEKLDPVATRQPVSASRLADFSKCGFLYLLKHVLRLEPALEPEERKRLEPLERGDRFHKVAERFLRERRDRGELPVRDTEAMRGRLLELADESLDELVAGSPPRFTPLWERERRRFRETMLVWLAREAASAERATPAWFEVGFGLRDLPAPGEPDTKEPLEIDLGDGRSLRVSGKIDRIDRRDDGTLVLRDYKTGRAPRDEGRIFRGGMQLQIPFYILAAARLFPGQPVVEAFLDYVDAARQVAVDPDVVRSEAFSQLMRGLVDQIAQGTFVQEPASCQWCDYTAVCGPRPLLERRRQIKQKDPRVQRMLQVRSLG
jgi:RecB family exonuclease